GPEPKKRLTGSSTHMDPGRLASLRRPSGDLDNRMKNAKGVCPASSPLWVFPARRFSFSTTNARTIRKKLWISVTSLLVFPLCMRRLRKRFDEHRDTLRV